MQTCEMQRCSRFLERKKVSGSYPAQVGSLDYLLLLENRSPGHNPEVRAMLQSEPSRRRARLAIMFHLVAVRTGVRRVIQSLCASGDLDVLLTPCLRSVVEPPVSSQCNRCDAVRRNDVGFGILTLHSDAWHRQPSFGWIQVIIWRLR